MDVQNQTVGIEALKEAISLLGNGGLARQIKRRPQDLNNWLTRGRVPAECCPPIERAVSGKVTCERLRPDVDWADRRYCPAAQIKDGCHE